MEVIQQTVLLVEVSSGEVQASERLPKAVAAGSVALVLELC